METQMSQRILSWGGLAAMGTIIMLAGCTQPVAMVASNPPFLHDHGILAHRLQSTSTESEPARHQRPH
jgi:hypothetical protein